MYSPSVCTCLANPKSDTLQHILSSSNTLRVAKSRCTIYGKTKFMRAFKGDITSQGVRFTTGLVGPGPMAEVQGPENMRVRKKEQISYSDQIQAVTVIWHSQCHKILQHPHLGVYPWIPLGALSGSWTPRQEDRASCALRF